MQHIPKPKKKIDKLKAVDSKYTTESMSNLTDEEETLDLSSIYIDGVDTKMMTKQEFEKYTEPLIGKRGVHNAKYYKPIEQNLDFYNNIDNLNNFDETIIEYYKNLLFEIQNTVCTWLTERPNTKRINIARLLYVKAKKNIDILTSFKKIYDDICITEYLLDVGSQKDIIKERKNKLTRLKGEIDRIYVKHDDSDTLYKIYEKIKNKLDGELLKIDDFDEIRSDMEDIFQLTGDKFDRFEVLGVQLKEVLKLQDIPMIYNRSISLIKEGLPEVEVIGKSLSKINLNKTVEEIDPNLRKAQIVHEFTHKITELQNYRALTENDDFSFFKDGKLQTMKLLNDKDKNSLDTFMSLPSPYVAASVNKITDSKKDSVKNYFYELFIELNKNESNYLHEGDINSSIYDYIKRQVSTIVLKSQSNDPNKGSNDATEVPTVINQIYYLIYKYDYIFKEEFWKSNAFKSIKTVSRYFQLRAVSSSDFFSQTLIDDLRKGDYSRIRPQEIDIFGQYPNLNV